jgi:hypothetical protein
MKYSTLVYGYVSTKQTYVSQQMCLLTCATTLGSWHLLREGFGGQFPFEQLSLVLIYIIFRFYLFMKLIHYNFKVELMAYK